MIRCRTDPKVNKAMHAVGIAVLTHVEYVCLECVHITHIVTTLVLCRMEILPPFLY